MLALAITQAGSYIRKTRRLDTYLDTLRSHRKRLLRKQPDIGNEYTSSTYAAFDLSFQTLPTKTQELLKLCAFLHHSDIPISLFQHSTEAGFAIYTVLDDYPPPEGDKSVIQKLKEILGSTWDEVEFQEIVESATRASFIHVSTDGLFYAVHPLLQMYIKDCSSQEDNREYARATTQLILGAIRPVEGSNARFWQLLPHATKIPQSVQSENMAHALAFYKLYHPLGSWSKA
ncbi:hypothetical protein PIIN_11618 [Serendipita indica DSM 11827]|uniref:Uncharacterized protein n=1 Tax=Serendipita indica (strain DSM 11827) TaxID=1109443 RepID=G4U247_SERID|nr:hypothetical protein PIIN_11618 [Serendipita indica DSM 11827]